MSWLQAIVYTNANKGTSHGQTRLIIRKASIITYDFIQKGQAKDIIWIY